MAGHWIPWECGLTRKREVVIISRALGVSRLEAAAMCMSVWEWAQDQSLDGLIVGMSPVEISDAVSLPGIGEAMQQAGWLIPGEGCVQFPNWERFNGRPAKARLQKSEQNQRQYQKRKLLNLSIAAH